MRLARRAQPRSGGARSLALAIAAVVAVAVLLPTPVALAGRSSLTPNSITPFPQQTAHQRIASQAEALADPHRLGAAATLGEPIAASVELAPGKRIGFVFNPRGKQIASRTVTLKATEADSATRRFRKAGATYYLLSWGALTGFWVRLGTGIHLITPHNWSVLVLVYRQTNFDVFDASAVSHHVQAIMSAENEALMVGAVTQSVGLANDWSSGLASQTETVVYPPTPVAHLTALGDGAYWLAPADIAADLATYAAPQTYDSIVVIWQPWDDEDYVPSWGWGLSLSAGPASNEAAYATVTVPPRDDSWWVTSMPHPGELYLHEWLHGVIDYNVAHGASIPDLHGSGTYGYVDEGGTWMRWYSDFMRQHVRDPATAAYVGISYLVWSSGSPRTAP